MKLRISRQAERDIVEINDFSASRWGEQQAESYLRALYAACEQLAKGSAEGRRRADLPPSYLAFKIASHVIVYRVDNVDCTLEVLNVLHPSMNIARRVATALRRREH